MVGLVAVVVMSPALGLIALLIWRRCGRPVFLHQKRVGLDGRTFEILKFRTMETVDNNPKLSITEEWVESVPDEFVYKSEGQPGVTRLGQVLRKYSLDELPQFFNVLKGEMSVVGPRPEIPDIARKYDSIQRQRLQVKPGITGLAQVSGRSELTHGEKIEYDLEYVDGLSFWWDLRIIWGTVAAAVRGKGAF